MTLMVMIFTLFIVFLFSYVIRAHSKICD